ncbi:CU044_2847 family protein [Novosphingobium naphthalenivorans]|uniref:CU044_2847 family protein n=1 Tax=Novosphingobium naphthalenivorans TaxID=273168 RepID=UPI0008326899|nr:CU044_2847 family protein [Novosphingobium naphthalenivorans]
MRVKLEDGSLVEVIDNSDQPTGEAFSATNTVALPPSEALSKVTKFANEAMNEFKKIGNPDEIEVEFGIEAGGEGGFFGIAKVHSKATITLKAKWVKP